LLNIYATVEHMKEIRHRFDYVLIDEKLPEITHRPQLMPNIIQYNQVFCLDKIKILPLAFTGHPVPTTGYIFNDGELAVIPDYKSIPPQTLEILKQINVNVLIMPLTAINECLYHAGIDIDLRYIDIIQPKRAIFTHLGPDCDYDEVQKLCASNMAPAFDNMLIEL
jgi:phosphoribosyl 1,2-cyclic phosphate phosphodiesterase